MLLSLLPALAMAQMVQAASLHVVFDRTGYRLTSLGEQVIAKAAVVDGQEHPVSAAGIHWRVADPSVASVSPLGVLVSKRVGYTKVWAISGRDSAAAIVIVDQWGAKVGFNPAAVSFTSVRDKAPLKVEVRDAMGHPLAPGSQDQASCRSANEKVASFQNAEVTALGAGVTYIRCAAKGLADSVRVEVRQRPVSGLIDAVSQRVVGDSFRLRMAIKDAQGTVIPDARPRWASLNPTVVTVEPATGLVRAIGTGQARVVGQLGDASATVSIDVQSGGRDLPSAPVDTAVTPAPTAAAKPTGPALKLNGIFATEGDTSKVTASAHDAKGDPISMRDLVLKSSDTSIAIVLSGERVVARKPGAAYLVGTLGSLKDSVPISIKNKTAAIETSSELLAKFKRPAFDSARLDSVSKRLKNDALRGIMSGGALPTFSGRFIAVSGNASEVAHSSHTTCTTQTCISASDVLETRAGLLYGASLELTPFSWLGANAEFKTGSLATSQGQGQSLNITEATAGITLFRGSALSIPLSYTLRSDSTDVGRQLWKFGKAGLVARFTFVGGLVNTITGVYLFPGASFTVADSAGATIANVVRTPSTLGSIGGDAGLEFHPTSFLTASLIYSVERFVVDAAPTIAPNPPSGLPARSDQFSMLRLRFGFQRGR